MSTQQWGVGKEKDAKAFDSPAHLVVADMSDDPIASGAVKRLRALRPAQFYLAAKTGNLAIDAVLTDIKDVLDALESALSRASSKP